MVMADDEQCFSIKGVAMRAEDIEPLRAIEDFAALLVGKHAGKRFRDTRQVVKCLNGDF